MMQDKRIREAVALLRDEGLVWSPDFEQIRLEMADVLEAIGKLPTHQLDAPLDELLLKLLAESPDTKNPATDPLEAWINNAAKTFRIV